MTLSTSTSKVAVLLLALSLGGCAAFKTKEEPKTIVIPPKYSEEVPIPKVAPTELKNIEWKLMNRAEMQKFLDAHKGEDFVIYTLDDKNAAILIGNIQELRRVIQSQQEVILYLKKVLDARTEKGDK